MMGQFQSLAHILSYCIYSTHVHIHYTVGKIWGCKNRCTGIHSQLMTLFLLGTVIQHAVRMSVSLLHHVKACSILSLSPLEENSVRNDQAFWKHGLACGCAGLKSLRQQHYQSDLIRCHTLMPGGHSGFAGHSASSKWDSYLSISLCHQSGC